MPLTSPAMAEGKPLHRTHKHLKVSRNLKRATSAITGPSKHSAANNIWFTERPIRPPSQCSEIQEGGW